MPLQVYTPSKPQRAAEVVAAAHLQAIDALGATRLVHDLTPDAFVRRELERRPELFTVEPGLAAVPDYRAGARPGDTMPARVVRFTLPAGAGRVKPMAGFVLLLYLDDWQVQPARVTHTADANARPQFPDRPGPHR